MKSFKETLSNWKEGIQIFLEKTGLIREREDLFKKDESSDKPEMDYYETLVTEIENDHKDVIAAYEKKYREKLKEERKK